MGFLTNLISATLKTALTPVAIVKDVVDVAIGNEPENTKKLLKSAAKDAEKATNPEIPCGICENTDVRTAITYHGIKVCHSCMEFLKKQSELNGRTWEEEISYQTKRLS